MSSNFNSMVDTSINVDPIYGLSHWDPFYFAHVLDVQLLKGSSCNETGTVILLPFITIQSFTSMSHQNGQCSCIPFMTSALVDGKSFIDMLSVYLCSIICLSNIFNFFCHHAFWDGSASFKCSDFQAHTCDFFLFTFTLVVPG